MIVTLDLTNISHNKNTGKVHRQQLNASLMLCLIPSKYLHFQSQQQKHWKKVSSMFKYTIKTSERRRTSLSIVEFEQVSSCWVYS